MGAVVTLPSAAPRKVRQDVPPGPRRRRALEAGQEAGKVYRLPLSHHVPPAYRAALAAEAAERDLYREGGMNRAAPWVLASALFAALDAERQAAVIANLRFLACLGSPGPKAALHFAERTAKTVADAHAADPEASA